MKKHIAAFLALFALFTVVTVAQDKSRTIVILDASGSMWGQISGKTKINIAKETAEDLIRNRPESLEMGFMAYGHRRKGDCEDIELLVPPGTETTESLLAALGKLIPKGKTPIFKSVLQAAESLKYTEEAGSVILVSDGIETCGGDLDALGKLLAEKGIDFKTHIIGFAMKDADTVGLRRLSDATGGTYSDAGDAAELKIALASAVAMAVKPVTRLTLVSLDEDGSSVLKNGVAFAIYKGKESESPVATGNGGQIGFEIEPGKYIATATFADRTLEAEVTAIDGENTTHKFTFSAPVLSLKAVLKEGGEPLNDGLSWKILGAADSEGKRKAVASSYTAQPALRLAPGEYTVIAARGNASVQKDIAFTDQPQEVSVVFGAGTLKVSAAPGEDEEAYADGLAWSVLGDPDSEGNRPIIGNSYDARPTFTLPAGSYLVSVKKGSASASQQMEIAAGEVTEERIILGSGTLKATAIMSEGQKPITEGLSWNIYGEGNAEGKRSKVTSDYGASGQFTLPSGSYTVSVKRGSATASQDFEIEAGKVTELTLRLNAALLKATAVMTAGGEPISDALSWKIHGEPDAEGKRPNIYNTYDGQLQYILPIGKYLVRVKRGSATAEAEVEVVAGKLNTASLNLNGALLKATAAMAEGGEPISDALSWKIYGEPDAEGKRPNIYNTYDGQLQYILPIGKYLVRVKRGSATAEAEVEVVAGKLNAAALNLNAALLKATAVMGEGGEPISESLSWKIYGEPDAEGKRPNIYNTYDGHVQYTLPLGKYLVKVSLGEATAETEVEVVAGKLTEVVLKFE